MLKLFLYCKTIAADVYGITHRCSNQAGIDFDYCLSIVILDICSVDSE